MKYLKVEDITNLTGEIDYKGLDIERFVAGSQHYCLHVEEPYCVIATSEETIPSHPDITVLTEAQYQDEVDTIAQANADYEASLPPSPMDLLQQQVEQQNLAIAELSMLLAQQSGGDA